MKKEKQIVAQDKNDLARYLLECYRHRDVLYTLSIRSLKIRYANTFLGLLWSILQPAISLFLLLLIFTKVASAAMCDIEPVAFIVVGLISWNWLSSSVSSSLSQAESLRELSSKVYFPRLYIGLSPVLTSLVDFTFVLFLALIIVKVSIHSLFYLGLAIIVSAVTVTVFSLLAGALVVRFTDVRHIVPVLLRVLFLASPIGYCLSEIDVSYRELLTLNPIAGTIQLYRYAFFGNPIETMALYSMIAFNTIGIILTITLWTRLDRQLGDL